MRKGKKRGKCHTVTTAGYQNLQFMSCKKQGEITESQKGRVTGHDIINSVNIKHYMLTMGDLFVELLVKGVDSAWYKMTWFHFDRSKHSLAFSVVLSRPGHPQLSEISVTFPLSLSG